jgi:hypothetical protein
LWGTRGGGFTGLPKLRELRLGALPPLTFVTQFFAYLPKLLNVQSARTGDLLEPPQGCERDEQRSYDKRRQHVRYAYFLELEEAKPEAH